MERPTTKGLLPRAPLGHSPAALLRQKLDVTITTPAERARGRNQE
ncbi:MULTISPECIES: hypothetical protein [Sphingomonas]|uniref:Uncharacterized protein n=1 Tax=Sphingomonas molluscorum TaxID=418184 RepID=A0ABU8Q3I1_9SPHN|nr:MULTISPECIES: hypothetical protein [unclassified Sphingomonas]MBM7405730.1 hypothetical protein [Sphingomonas sp. JUb134]